MCALSLKEMHKRTEIFKQRKSLGRNIVVSNVKVQTVEKLSKSTNEGLMKVTECKRAHDKISNNNLFKSMEYFVN